MKAISTWASRHLWPARFLIVGSCLLLHGIAFLLGNAFATLGLELPLYWVYILLVPACFAWCTYPARRQYKTTFTARKTRDFIMATTGFLMMVCLANQTNKVMRGFQPAWSSQPAMEQAPVAAAEPKKHPLSLKKRMLRKLKQNISELRRHYQQASRGEKIALILLSVVVSIALLYLVAALSCTLACNGADILAVAVLLLGTGLITFLFIRVIRSLNRKYPWNRKGGDPEKA